MVVVGQHKVVTQQAEFRGGYSLLLQQLAYQLVALSFLQCFRNVHHDFNGVLGFAANAV